MKFIFKDVSSDDLVLAVRAAKWLHEREHADSILCYGERPDEKCFYVKRNKASITVRPA